MSADSPRALPPSRPRAAGGWLNGAGFVALLIFTGVAAYEVQLDRRWLGAVALLVVIVLSATWSFVIYASAGPLELAAEGFRLGRGPFARTVKWIHVSDFRPARIRFPLLQLAAPDSERANAVMYRLNRALTAANRPGERLLRLSLGGYFDGFVHNAHGIPTEELIETLRDWQQRAEPVVAAKDRHRRPKRPPD
jgi:hypothetical protein